MFKSSLVLVLLAVLLRPDAAGAWSIQRIVGDVTLEDQGKSVSASIGAVLKPNVALITGADGKAFVKDGESEIWIGSQSRFVISRPADVDNDVIGRLDLIRGKLRAKFKRPSGPQEFPWQVKARSVVAGVRGTEFFVAVETADERVCTLEGLVRVSSLRSSGESWDVPAGRGLFVKKNEMPKVRESAADQVSSWIKATSF